MWSFLRHGKKGVRRIACLERSPEEWRWRPSLYALALPHHSPSPFLFQRADHIVYNRFSTQRDSAEGPSPVDYSSLLDEREFHKVADELLHHLQERFDELGEECALDEFDVDYAEGVLTIKLGPSGTYVINKQTPNRQIWLSSPVSGPARFDWDTREHHWVYRRTKDEIFGLLEKEVQDLVGASFALSK